MQNPLDAFVNDILEQKGFGDQPDDVKEMMRKDMRKRVDEFIMARTIAAFSDEDLQTFEHMIDDNKSQGDLQKFAMEHIEEYKTFLAATLIEFQNVCLAVN